VATTPYDPVTHRWWAMREQGGTFYWETSPNGAAWQTLGSWPIGSMFPVDGVYLEYGAGTEDTGVTPGEAQFDNLNGGPPPTEGWCPTSSFVDDFTDGVISVEWDGDAQYACTVSEVNGDLVYHFDGTGYGDCDGWTTRLYDLTGDTLSVEVGAPASAPTLYMSFGAVVAPGSWAEFYREGDLLRLEIEVDWNVVSMTTLAYSAVDHRWWRLAEQGGTVHWYTSADGVAWVDRFQAVAPFPVTGVQVAFDTWGGEGLGPFDVTWDHYNLPP
jgi:hypothetical protein